MAHHPTRERVEREFGVRVIDLADATGYSPSYISLILSGKREAPAACPKRDSSRARHPREDAVAVRTRSGGHVSGQEGTGTPMRRVWTTADVIALGVRTDVPTADEILAGLRSIRLPAPTGRTPERAMSQRDELLRAARDYIIRRGWPVFVLSSSKVPVPNCERCRIRK